MASFVTMSSTRQSDETMEDDDDKDDTKRKSRNLSEKKRRDQFNMLINELGSMVTTNTRKMDKSTVLKSTMLFLKNHNEVAVRSRAHEIQEDWKPAFLSNEEFTHLILEALDGFIMVLSSNGRIYYASESVTSLLGYLPSELANSTIYEITYQEDQSLLYNVLLNPSRNHDPKDENQVSFTCHIKRGRLDLQEEATYERVDFAGYFRSDADIESLIHSSRYGNISPNDTKLIFVGTGRLHTPQLIQDMSLIDGSRSEFTSRHSLEWKFLFLDHRAPPIIGYLPFEVLGTSGYDYYHVDDLDKVVTCHESLMQKGEGTSCHYRFLTKGQQWIWLQTRFYIDYNQWNSKPEFIVCTHNVVSYTEVMKQLKQDVMHTNQDATGLSAPQGTASSQTRGSLWSPTSWKDSRPTRRIYQSRESEPSANFRQSTSTIHSSKLKIPTRSSSKAPETSSRSRQQLESDSASSSYVEPLGFAAEPILTVVSTPGFLSSSTTTARSLPAQMLAQPNVISTTQNQMQDELQRKHEELQQLIVHQQEELRRVSEQLFNAKYGILYPLINVALPYDANSCQGSISRCDGSPGGDATQAVDNVLSVPLNVPVTVVDTFANSCADPSQSHSRVSQLELSQQRHLLQKHDVAMEHMQPQAAPVLPDNQMIPFDLCQQSEMMYSNLGAANGQQSTAGNE